MVAVDRADLRRAHFELGNDAAAFETSYGEQIRHVPSVPSGHELRIEREEVVLARAQARHGEGAALPATNAPKVGSAVAFGRDPESFATEYSAGINRPTDPATLVEAAAERKHWGARAALHSPLRVAAVGGGSGGSHVPHPLPGSSRKGGGHALRDVDPGLRFARVLYEQRHLGAWRRRNDPAVADCGSAVQHRVRP